MFYLLKWFFCLSILQMKDAFDSRIFVYHMLAGIKRIFHLVEKDSMLSFTHAVGLSWLTNRCTASFLLLLITSSTAPLHSEIPFLPLLLPPDTLSDFSQIVENFICNLLSLFLPYSSFHIRYMFHLGLILRQR